MLRITAHLDSIWAMAALLRFLFFVCVFIFFLDAFRLQKRAMATRALIQLAGSPADPNPLTPWLNVWNVSP